MSTSTSTKAVSIPKLQDTSILTSKVTTPKLTATTKLYSFGGFIQKRINLPLIIVGLVSLLLFVGALIAVLVVVMSNRSKKNSKHIYDLCVDNKLNCYKQKCYHPYIAKKTTSFDGQSCLPVRPPWRRDHIDGECVKAANFVVPWCYVTSEPPFMRKSCYKFCDEIEECVDDQLNCYTSSNPKCSGDQYTYKGQRGHYTLLKDNSTHPCSKPQWFNSAPYCMLKANSRAPWCYYGHFNRTGFCYASCGALKHIREFGIKAKDKIQGYFDYASILIGSVMFTFYGVNPFDCTMLCSGTPGCFYYSISMNKDGKCQLLREYSIKAPSGNTSSGWISKNDTILLCGGKTGLAVQSERLYSSNTIRTLHIENNRIVEGEFPEALRLPGLMDLLTGTAHGKLYILTYDPGHLTALYITIFDQRGHTMETEKHDRKDIGKVVYGAAVTTATAIFMCGGLRSTSSSTKGAEVDAYCSVYDISMGKFMTDKYSYDSVMERIMGKPREMLIPRIHFFMVQYHGLIFAFMGCQERVEDCTEMVKPIHYFVISYNEWHETGTNMQIDRINYGYARYKDKVYVCGGLSLANRSEVLDTCEVYKLVNENFTVPSRNTTIIKGLPSRIQDLAMAVIGEMLLAIGGRHSTDESNVTNAIYRYNDSDNSWSLFDRMKYRRYGMGVAVF